MKETLRLILVLTITAALTGALLALANRLTEEPISEARRAELLAALNVVLPPHDNEPDHEKIVLNDQGREWVFYPARMDNEFVGAAFTANEEGYGGKITVLTGVTADGRIHAVHILQQLETPGLGANISLPGFTDQFRGGDITRPERLKVRQDGGGIQAITAATISSRAVTEAVSAGIQAYLANRAAVSDRPKDESRQ